MYSSHSLPDETGYPIEMYLSGKDLMDMDFFSKSDPYIKVYFQVNSHAKEQLICRTETIDNNLNPVWKKPILLSYIFEAVQYVRFEVYDDDGGKDDFIGMARETLGTFTGAKHQTTILTLQNPKKPKAKCGKLIVRIEPMKDQGSNLLAM